MARTLVYDQLRVSVFATVNELARAAAENLRAILRQTIAERGEASVILATGNSQLASVTWWRCLTPHTSFGLKGSAMDVRLPTFATIALKCCGIMHFSISTGGGDYAASEATTYP